MKIVSTLTAASIAIGAVATFAEPEHVQRKLILGGSVVPKGSKTYNVGLRFTLDGETICGGVLVSPLHVMTTPSCTLQEAAITHVAVGAHSLSGIEDGAEYIEVVLVQTHPWQNFSTIAYDFSILTLNAPSNHTPIQLPNAGSKDTFIDLWAMAMGWGPTTYPDGPASTELRGVKVQVWDNIDCVPHFSFVSDSNLCAGGVKLEDSCSLDNGGPLVKEGENGNPDILIGLSSFGDGCGYRGIPSVYARVSAALKWINEVITQAR